MTRQRLSRVVCSRCALTSVVAVNVLAFAPLKAQTLVPSSTPVSGVRVRALNGGPAELTTIGDLTVDQRGRIYVLETSQQRIAVFGPQGTFLRHIGRKGQGPGEFQSAQSLTIQHDSLWVLDVRLDRITGFPLINFGTPRTLSLRANIDGRKIGARVPDGVLVLRPRRSPSGNGFSSSASGFDILHANDQGDVADSITTLARMPESMLRFALYRGGDTRSTIAGQVSTYQPFNDMPLWVIDADGRAITALDRHSASQSALAHVRLTRFSLRGAALAKRDLSYTPKPVSASAVQEIVDSIAKPLRLPNGATVSGNAQAIRAALYVPQFHAPVSDFKAGLDGTLWLRLQTQVDAPVEWVQTTADGVPLIRVAFPRGFVMLRATATEVWGARRDGDGVPVVEAYRYVKQ